MTLEGVEYNFSISSRYASLVQSSIEYDRTKQKQFAFYLTKKNRSCCFTQSACTKESHYKEQNDSSDEGENTFFSSLSYCLPEEEKNLSKDLMQCFSHKWVITNEKRLSNYR